MASSSSAVSQGPFRDIGNKRKDAPNDDAKPAAAKKQQVTTTAENEIKTVEATTSLHETPSDAFSKRLQALNDACKKAGPDYGILHLVPEETERKDSILELAIKFPILDWKEKYRMEVFEANLKNNNARKAFEESNRIESTRAVELMDDATRQEFYSKLTDDKQIDYHYKVLVVRKDVIQKLKHDLLQSKEDHNDLHPEVARMWEELQRRRRDRQPQKDLLMNLLQGATQAVHQAIQDLIPNVALTNKSNKGFSFPTKEQSPTTTMPNVARAAFERCLATIMICNEKWEWRIDEDCDCKPIIRSITKMLRALLWFRDDELGLVDPFSRNTLLLCLRTWSMEWRHEGEWPDDTPFQIQYQHTKGVPNNNGKGRSLVVASPPKKRRAPPATMKEPEVTVPGKDAVKQEFVLNYLVALGDKLAKRQKTHVQLQIEKIDAKKGKEQDFCRVIVSGAMDMRKLGQLMAYLIGESDSFTIDINRGKRLKHSFFQFLVKDNHFCNIGDKDKVLQKTFRDDGTLFLFDRSIKITQVFQGLVTTTSGGMMYDSAIAKRVSDSSNSLTWVHVGDLKTKYVIRCQGIIGNQSVHEKWPLPRVLDGGEFCGKDARMMNYELRGDRKGGPSFLARSDTPQRWIDCIATEKTLDEICDGDGVVDEEDSDSWFHRLDFTPEKLAAAGPPAPWKIDESTNVE